MSLSVRQLSKKYDQQVAVHQISFDANKGEVLGFLGPNGAGKSTTMKIATGFLSPTEGEVFVCGMEIRDQPLECRRKIGYLPEHNPLYLDMYVHEYLNFIAKVQGVSSNNVTKRCKEIINLCGLEREQNKKIGALSKGYRQRVGLGQALIHDPEVLILDEPTTGLDPNQIHEIREVIKSISSEKTIVFSTHILQEVQALCHKVVIINRGRLVANDDLIHLKSGNGERHVYFTFSTEVPYHPSDFPSFDGGVIRIEALENNSFHLVYHGLEDIRPKIFQWVASQGFALNELREEVNSLEKIFYSLTQNTIENNASHIS